MPRFKRGAPRRARKSARYAWTGMTSHVGLEVAVPEAILIGDPTTVWDNQFANGYVLLERIRGYYSFGPQHTVGTAGVGHAALMAGIGILHDDETYEVPSSDEFYSQEDIMWTGGGLYTFDRSTGQVVTGGISPVEVVDVKVRRKVHNEEKVYFMAESDGTVAETSRLLVTLRCLWRIP